MSLLARFGRKWRRWNLREIYKASPGAADRLYLTRDPWELDCDRERHRLRETVRIIREAYGSSFDRILEIGSGEGLHTRDLAFLGREVIGLDLSSRAVMRARQLGIRNARFEAGDFGNFAKRSEDRYDLITACEVFYYLEDWDEAWDLMNRMGKTCLVTYFGGAFDELDSFFQSKPVSFETIEFGGASWRVVHWSQPDRFVEEYTARENVSNANGNKLASGRFQPHAELTG